MAQRGILFWLVLVVLFLVGLGVVLVNESSLFSSNNVAKREFTKEREKAVAAAKFLYQEKVNQGVNLSSGPCLTNDLLPGWVADTVHRPREAVDDLPENQCAAFREGRAEHFVELDLEGRIVRAE